MRNWLSERFGRVRPKAHSTLFYLIAANLAVAVPVALMTTVLVVKYGASERAAMVNAMDQKAGEIAARVDQELAAQLMAGNWVATSPALESGDWARFYERARRSLTYYGEAILVATESGRQLVNTHARLDAPLEADPPEQIAVSKRALAENAPVYSNVFFGRRAQKWLVNLVLPAACPTSERCVVKVSAGVDRIRRLLTLDNVPANYLVTAYDRDFNVIARNRDDLRPPDGAALRQAIAGQPAGHLTQERPGEPLRAAYARTAQAGWYVAITAPEAELNRSISDTLGNLVLEVLLLFSGATLVALLMARNIASSIHMLERAALDPTHEVKSYVTEVNAVGAILRERARKIEEQKEKLEETIQRIHMLMRETLHKAKNQLQVIQSIATQTARNTSSPSEFVSRFSDRLHGLSRTQNLLVKSDYRGLTVRELLQDQIPVGFRDRVDRIGPEVTVLPEPGLNLGMAFHELADNAIKFGALSAVAGAVTVTWGLDPPTQSFFIEWVETGGPVVHEPVANGFGSVVVKTLVAASFSGKVDMRFPPDGFVWRLEGSMDYLKRD